MPLWLRSHLSGAELHPALLPALQFHALDVELGEWVCPEAFRQADWLSHGGDPLRISRAAIAC